MCNGNCTCGREPKPEVVSENNDSVTELLKRTIKQNPILVALFTCFALISTALALISIYR